MTPEQPPMSHLCFGQNLIRFQKLTPKAALHSTVNARLAGGKTEETPLGLGTERGSVQGVVAMAGHS